MSNEPTTIPPAAIDLYSRINSPIEAIDRLGEWLARSGFGGCDKVEQGKVLAWACLAERKTPVQIVREYHIIEGKLADRADSLLAKFLAAGGKREGIVRTESEAAITLTARDGTRMQFRATWEEMQKEPFIHDSKGGLKKNWRTPRARMQTLWARVISDGVRTLAPEIACGIKTPEEIEDESDAAPPALDLCAAHPQAPPSHPPINPRAPIKPASAATLTIDVSAAPVAEPAPKPDAATAVGAPPTPTPAPDAATTAAPQPATAAPSGGKLDAATVAKLETIIGTHAIAAGAWLIAKGHLKPGDGLDSLSGPMAAKIIRLPARFIQEVTRPTA